jgi:lysozyme family protein
MAAKNFDACLAVTLAHEGGWSDHPADPGGATMKGITIGRFRQYYPNATKTDLRNISDAMLRKIYHDDYWLPVRGEDLPHGVDLATFDFGVNSGPSRGARYLQWVVGTKQDGVIGPQTLKATILADGKAVIQKLCARRLSFVQGLKTFRVFGRGWSRRIADVEAKAVAMWLAKGAGLSAAARKQLAEEAAKADRKSKQQSTGAGGVGAGGGGVVAVGEPNWLLIALLVLLAIAGVALVIKARQNRDRAEAYRAAMS